MKSRKTNKTSKKIAIVHDAIVEYGGGEKVLEKLSKLTPEADIFTSLLRVEYFKLLKLQKEVKTAWIQNLILTKKWSRIIQIMSPIIWPTLNLKNYDIVITHGGFYLAHLVNLAQNPSTLYIHYSISPPKNLYFKSNRQWFEEPLNYSLYPILRYFDKKAAKKVNAVWAVSKSVKSRINKIYKRDSTVLYPPISIPKKIHFLSNSNRKYYCYAGRLEKDKRVDYLINVFNENKLPLVIIGTGKDETRLRKLANSNISFLGFKDSGELYKFFYQCKGFIHPAVNDDFPLTPIEAMARGVPVIAHKSGGTKEAIEEGVTGLLFSNYTLEDLQSTIKKFESINFDHKKCYKKAIKYSEKRFEKEYLDLLSLAYEKFQ